MHIKTDLAQRTLARLLSVKKDALFSQNDPMTPSTIEPPAQPGMWAEWVSPLFGPCTGQIVSVTVKGYLVTNHSVIGPEEHVEIPVEWITGVT